VEGPFELHSRAVGALPVVGDFCGRLGLDELLERYVPARGPRLALAPEKVLGAVVRNLLVSHQPVYQLGEWAAPCDPGLLGLGPKRWAC
jgi:hypothetical protein